MTLERIAREVRPVRIEDEMRAAYLDYAMSVIVSRALPDVRDGLKPVQRRILYVMWELGLRPGQPFKKSARIVGEVLGKYHPHGDDPVYEAMVRMAQPFTMRYPLVDGQGNFGSIDDDPPAAMRYTEARLAPIAEEMLADIEKETVDFVPNFDDTLREPTVLPTRLPNLLVNGASGIAVGMATDIPPHNLGEICEAVSYLIDHPDATTEELARIVRGPDFPTGGIVFRYEKVKAIAGDGHRVERREDAIARAYAEGRGRIVMQARARIEPTARGHQIVVTELPYRVAKAALVARIAELARDRRIEGIADVRDESDREGLRIVVEVKRDANPRQVLAALYKHTPMQMAYNVNMLALVGGQPRTVGLKGMLTAFVEHRREVVRRRAQFDLARAQEREHILQGLMRALDHLDQVIRTIREASSAEEARSRLMAPPFHLTERQAQAVLDMQLRRLARLEREKLRQEYEEVIKEIAYLEDLLANPRKVDHIIQEEMRELKKQYGDPRRTLILEQEPEEMSEEDLVPHQTVVVVLSARGYIKRVPLSSYRAQRRGGKGVTSMRTRDDDALAHLVVADTRDDLFFLTDRGRCFQVRAYEVPEEGRHGRGQALVNLVGLDQGERVTAVVRHPQGADHDYLVLATRLGEVKRTPLTALSAAGRRGIVVMDLEPGDSLVSARLAHDGQEVILVTAQGKALRFPVEQLRLASRKSGGVRGIRLAPGDEVVAMEVVEQGGELLVVSARGYGKRTPIAHYPTHHRGGQGVITYKTGPRTGPLATARLVFPNDQLVILSQDGVALRTAVADVPLQGRSTQGVKIMELSPQDRVVGMAVVPMDRGGDLS
ncbi:MAG: DNA gyrase subunit A [Dehalococcoidia bacterium]|jgi:DNA gyrase subunit A|nr:DNA gyrase subunit A [Dehalococcoidia bacterium]